MILVTGANGFIGSAIVQRIQKDGEHNVRGAVRQRETDIVGRTDYVSIGDLSGETDWRRALESIRTVVHTAARVHTTTENPVDNVAEFRKVNVEGTISLAQQAVSQGVRRLIFISSIKVNGEETTTASCFRPDDIPAPLDAYGASKFEAEQALLDISDNTGLEIVIIRPPLVYGPGVKANFETMIKWSNRRVPLPFGAIRNKRSLVGLINLVDVIIRCLEHPKAVGQIFLVSDDNDLSTTELLRRTSAALGKSALLVPVPQRWLEKVTDLLNVQHISQRLFCSLRVDMSKTKRMLDWSPPITVDDELRSTVQYWLDHQRRTA